MLCSYTSADLTRVPLILDVLAPIVLSTYLINGQSELKACLRDEEIIELCREETPNLLFRFQSFAAKC